MNLPPRQCSPLNSLLHCFGMPREIRYLGVNRLWMLPWFASQPLGMSIERILSQNLFSAGMKCLYGARSQPVNGNPKIPSIISCLSPKCSTNAFKADSDEGYPKSLPAIFHLISLSQHSFRKFPFLPSSSLKIMRSTEQFIIFRCLAATSPSPPLLPGPTSTHTRSCLSLVRIILDTCATAIPAISIRVSEGNEYFDIRLPRPESNSSHLQIISFMDGLKKRQLYQIINGPIKKYNQLTMISKTSECPICLQELSSDQCMVDCAAGHVMHYQCITNGMKSGIDSCPFDRQKIAKCLHQGMVKNLPQPPKKEPEPQPLMVYEQTPCYICNCNTRGDLEFDQVVICSGCESIYVHAECQERISSRRFNYGVMWFCPACRGNRLSNAVRRTRRAQPRPNNA